MLTSQKHTSSGIISKFTEKFKEKLPYLRKDLMPCQFTSVSSTTPWNCFKYYMRKHTDKQLLIFFFLLPQIILCSSLCPWSLPLTSHTPGSFGGWLPFESDQCHKGRMVREWGRSISSSCSPGFSAASLGTINILHGCGFVKQSVFQRTIFHQAI